VLDLYYPAVSVISVGVYSELCYRAIYTDLSQETQRSMCYLFLGVVMWFLGDIGYSVTALLPSQHWLAYHNGSWIDFAFAAAFWLAGLGLLQLTAEQVTLVDR
jgi:hypothetical protein